MTTMEAPTEVEVPAGTTFCIAVKRVFFQTLVTKAANVIPTRDVMPVLRNFQVQAETGRLRIAATDLELSVVSTTELVKTIVPGRIVLPAKKMQEIAAKAVGDDVRITVVNGVAQIDSGAAHWTQKLESGTDYPPLPDITDVTLYDIDRGKFLNGLQSVKYAAASPSGRANLALIDLSNGRMTASDGARFQQIVIGEELPFSIQIPVSAVDDLTKLLQATDLGAMKIGESENHIVFNVGYDVFCANKLMTVYPDIQGALVGDLTQPRDPFIVDREELLGVVGRVAINADSESRAIALKLTTDSVTVVSRDKFGNACEEAMSASWTGADRMLVVNHKFLADMLKMYDGRSCKFLLGPDLNRSKKSTLMLRDEQTGMIGVIQQMRADYTLND